MCLAFQVQLISCALLFCCCEATPISLSPLGMVNVCPGGQVLLTCERVTGSILYWDVSVPHLAGDTTQRIVLSQGDLLSPEFKIDFIEFNITRTSDDPLISQLLINNVTTEINGSTIYCSEDGDETNAPMTAINIPSKDEFLRSMDRSLNVTMVNQLRSDDVTVTLQWPREPGAVYNVSVSPEVSHTELTSTSMEHNVFTTNLTISYDIQYNVSIVSSLCGVITSKVFNYVTCDYPPTQSLNDPVAVISGSQDSPPIEGQFITYTCPTGFILTGSNASVCTGNREWEPDPGQVDCIADCGSLPEDRNLKFDYNSTLEGSILTLTCENEMSNINTNPQIDKPILNVTCHSNRNWVPNPTYFIGCCSTVTTVTVTTTSPDAETSMTVLLWTPVSSILISVNVVSSIVFLSVGYVCGWFSHKYKQACSTTRTSNSSAEENTSRDSEGSQPQTPGPLYDELSRSTSQHQDLVELKENVAYGPIIMK